MDFTESILSLTLILCICLYVYISVKMCKDVQRCPTCNHSQAAQHLITTPNFQ